MKDKKESIAHGIICFAGEDWWYHNQGHYDMQIMRRFAKNTKVLFVNSIVMQRPKLRDGAILLNKIKRKLKSISNGLQQVEENYYVYSPFSVPLHQWRVGRRMNQALVRTQVAASAARLGISHPLIWVVCPAACPIALRLSRSKLVYQRTDCFEEFQGSNGDYIDDSIRKYDRLLKRKSECVIYVSKFLYEKESLTCRKAFLSDHGVEYEYFSMAQRDSYIPEDIASIPHPIVGFFGAIDDHTFDVALATDMAKMMPEHNFVFIGHASSNVERLRALPNVYMLGQRSLMQIPYYGKCFDVAIMPWAQNRWIEACNPVKLKEYLALGKAIVSVPFVQLSEYNGFVNIACDANEFCSTIRTVLATNQSDRIQERRQRVQSDTWDNIADQLRNMILS